MGYSVFLKMLTSAKLLLFHYIYGPLIQYPPGENWGKKIIVAGIRKIKKEDKEEKIHN